MSDKKKRSMAGLPWIAAMAFFMQALDATILNTALPAIAHSLNRSPLAMQSAIISYTLTVAMLIPVSGWLADRFGTRRIFTLAVSLFTLGSLACALSNSLPQLVVFRVIQGIGGAMMMPVARLALLRAYPRNELLPVLNFVASWIALTVIVTSIWLLLLYILHARRTPNPLISLDLFKTRTFSIGIVGNIATRLGTGCVPFLMPLMLQVGFGYQAFIAGCMMAPTALGSIIAKSMVTQVLRRLGYRHTLVGITVIIGLMIAQFSLQSPAMAIWMLILPLFILGMAMSTQFTAMNTITLADLTDDNASSGNSVLAVTQQLSISLGVAVSAAVLRVYEGMEGTTTVEQFHYTFITMGIITVASAAMFMLLKTTDGNNLIKRQRKSKPNRVPSESE
ncbi:TPA: MFS transporter [Escherichia coli]|nr:MFS transporter [Escherichia coli]